MPNMRGMASVTDALPLKFRHCSEADLPALLALYESAGITGEQKFSVSEAKAQLRLIAEYPNYCVWVAFSDDALVGTYELLIMDNMAKAGAKSAIVEDVAVLPEYQGQGIGRLLMRHAMAQARQAGCYKLMLSSNKKRVDAHQFYERLGFEQHGLSFLTQC